MYRRPPRSTRTDTLFPYTTLFRSSLKARAVGFLSRREHSRLELERKLAPYAADAAELERVLDQLEREQWLSNQRFAQALVNRRAQRQGVARIVQELRQHGLADEQITALRAQLPTTEIQRRSEEHTSELQSLMRISYAVYYLKKKTTN